MKTIVLVNSNAGKQQILKELDGIEAVFEAEGQVELVRTESKEEAVQAIKHAADKQPDRLVVCGGDGTLSETVDVLLSSGKKVPLGYIPAGTTNDFANFLGLPKDPVKAASHICMGSARPIDVGRFGSRYFIYVASFGAFTQSSYNTNQSLKNTLGHLAYIIEGIKELPALQSYLVRVETVEGSVDEGEYLFGAMSSSTSLGGIIKLDAEKVDATDGLFELALVKMPKSLLELNRIILSLMGGKPDEELITFVHTKGAVFTCQEPMPWSLDGEYCAGGSKVEVEVVHNGLEMFW